MIKLKNIQVTRGIAALIVCFFHSRYLVDIPDSGKVMFHIRETIGMPLFYIISGFVMVLISPSAPDGTFKTAIFFFVKRLIRILPLFYLAIVLYLVVCHNNCLYYFTAGAKTLAKTIFFIPLFTDSKGPAYGFSFYYVSWSLNYEILFYIIFSLSLLFSKFRFHFMFTYYTVFIFLLPLIAKGYFSISPDVNYKFSIAYLNFLTNPIQLFFISGILFGIVLSKYAKYLKKIPSLLMYTAYSLALFFLFVYGSRIIPSFVGSDLVVCSLFVYMMVATDFKVRIPYPKLLLYFGDISYCIYLLHPIVYIYLVGLVRKFGLRGLESSWYFALLGITVVVIVSALVHEFFEKKIIAYLRSRLIKSMSGKEIKGFKNDSGELIIPSTSGDSVRA